MRWIPSRTFLMGSEDFYPEERPVRRVEVAGFWMDTHLVTAADFRRFVRETRYVTVAERPLDPEQDPDADPDLLQPGSIVLRRTCPTPRAKMIGLVAGLRIVTAVTWKVGAL